MTVRINVVKSSPSTRFLVEADHWSTSIAGNYSIVRVFLEAKNGPSGNTSSRFDGGGLHRVGIDGEDSNVAQQSVGGNFLPSGYAANARRWRYGPYYVRVDHASNGMRTAVVRMTINYGAINESHVYSLSLPNIPQVPTSLSADRISDSQIKLTWTRQSTYTGVSVQRRVNGGSWQTIANPKGNASTYTDTTTTGNRKYEYRVAGKASAGTSAYSASATVYTTPAAPTGVVASRSGDDIVVDATTPPYATSFDVADGGVTVATGVTLPWTHTAPDPANPHTYTVRSKRGSLVSGWSSPSNTVQLLSAPNPPAGLAPNGAVRASDEDVTFQWTHNPVDASPQAEFEVRHRPTGGAWTVETGTTAPNFTTPLDVGVTEWEVRTKGSHPDWSPWSATATVEVVDRPGVAVVQPDTTWDASILTVGWTFFQAQSRPQSGWELELKDASGEVVTTRNGAGGADQFPLTYRVGEGDWTVAVRAATGSVWSDWAETTFTVAFEPPPAPVLDAVWDETQGGIAIDVSPGEGVPETVSVVVERRMGGDWEPVLEVTELTSFVDWESWSHGDIEVRATALTAEGAATSTTVVVEARSTAIWLSCGVGFGDVCRLPLSPEIRPFAGRERGSKGYSGRGQPHIVVGEGTWLSFEVSGKTWDSMDNQPHVTAPPDDLIRVAQSPERLHLLRTPDGKRVYGMVSGIDLPRLASMRTSAGWNGHWGYSFTLTQGT